MVQNDAQLKNQGFDRSKYDGHAIATTTETTTVVGTAIAITIETTTVIGTAIATTTETTTVVGTAIATTTETDNRWEDTAVVKMTEKAH